MRKKANFILQDRVCARKIVQFILLNLLLLIPLFSISVFADDTLVWPVPGHKILSQHFHRGNAIDISDGSIAGAMIVSACNGTVGSIFTCGENHYGSEHDCHGFGTGVVIIGDDGRAYQYAHMQPNSIPGDVYFGARVTAGQKIGQVGMTGDATGYHLHFGISYSRNYWEAGPDPEFLSYTDDASGTDYVYLDVNGVLDGQTHGSVEGYGVFDVSIKGKLVASGVSDYYDKHPVGTQYTISNIKATNGHQYIGPTSGTLSGTIGKQTVNVVLGFATVYEVNLLDDYGASWNSQTVLKGKTCRLPEQYPKLSTLAYFCGWSRQKGSETFEYRPGDTITPDGNLTLYPVYVTHLKAISGSEVYIYNISDFTDTGYNIEKRNTTMKVSVDASYWTDWSGYSLNPVSANANTEVRTAPMYRYYSFRCRNCGSCEPFSGSCDGCGGSLPVDTWTETWSTIPYGNSSYTVWPGATSKCYTYALGDGNRWNFDSAHIGSTGIGTTDATGATVIKTGYSYRTYVQKTSEKSVPVVAYVLTKAAATECTVKYGANGGKGTMPDQTVQVGDTLKLPANAFTAPSGKQFKAWKIGSEEYAVGASYKVTGNTTVTAVWQDIPAGNRMQVSVESKTAPAGGKVDIALTIANNPGIAMTQFRVAFDSALTLESVDAGTIFNSSDMTPGSTGSNPYTVMFVNTRENQTGNGTLAILHFRVADKAVKNSSHTISISGIASDINEKNIDISFTNGEITVRDINYGDVNDDGTVNGLDVLRLGKFITGWNVTVNQDASDTNGDGEINGLDQLRLSKFCSGWPVTLGK